MRLKANLHFHCADDPEDVISYALHEGIDYAAECGFSVLASTCHNKVVWSVRDARYAADKNILLLPGIELGLRENAAAGKHVVILNCGNDAEGIRTFEDLASYRRTHPDIFVIAPHPYFYGNFSLKGLLDRHIELFDGIEHSWFYSRRFNRNVRAIQKAKEVGLPLIATSDTHYLRHFNDDYAIIHAAQKTTKAVIEALRRGAVENVTIPKSAIRDMLVRRGAFTIKGIIQRIVRLPNR